MIRSKKYKYFRIFTKSILDAIVCEWLCPPLVITCYLFVLFRGEEITILFVGYLRVVLASQTKEILVFILVPYVRNITEVVAEHFDHKKKLSL